MNERLAAWQHRYDVIRNLYLCGAIDEDQAGERLIAECRFRDQALVAELRHFRDLKKRERAA